MARRGPQGAMRRWREVSCASCLAIATACGFAPAGEYTVEACSDNIDNDGNGDADCKDVGCRALSICGALPEADVSLEPLDPPAGPADAGHVKQEPPKPTPTPIEPDEDAGWPTTIDPCDELLCDPDQICIEGACESAQTPSPTTRRLRVQMNSLELGSALGQDGQCLDAAVPVCFPACVSPACDSCVCAPDPFAQVHVDGTLYVDGEYKAQTPIVPNTLAINPWDTSPLDIRYEPGQTVEVVVYEYDDPDHSERLFACPLPTDMVEQMVSCTGPAVGLLIKTPSTLSVFVSPL